MEILLPGQEGIDWCQENRKDPLQSTFVPLLLKSPLLVYLNSKRWYSTFSLIIRENPYDRYISFS